MKGKSYFKNYFNKNKLDLDIESSGQICIEENNSQILKNSQNENRFLSQINCLKFKSETGVSLITLVVTIIVIIILASILLRPSLNAVDKASYAKFAHELSEIQGATDAKRTKNASKGPGEAHHNRGFTKVVIDNPPDSFVSFDEDEITGYWVDLDFIELKDIQTGRETLRENRVTFGREDVYVYDSEGKVYYAKGWIDEGGNLHYKVDETAPSNSNIAPPTIENIEYVLSADKESAIITVVAIPTNGGELNVTGDGQIAIQVGTNTYQLVVDKNGLVRITVKEINGSKAVQSILISGIEKKVEYSIIYNTNGGSGALSTQRAKEGTRIQISDIKPNREGYAFRGWATSQVDASNGNVTYNGGESYVVTGNLTLYAVWEAVNVEISNLTISNIAVQTYTGSEIKPEPVVKDSGKTLTLNTDYTLTYSNNINVGTANITVTGKGKYVGSKTISFEITKANMSGIKVLGYEDEYDGEAHGIEIQLTGTSSGASVKYGVAADSCTETRSPKYTQVGTYTIYYEVIKENYNIEKGSAIVRIKALDISENVTISTVSDQNYTGSEIRPEPKVKYGSETLTKDQDYTLSYSNNINVGTATIIVTGKGNYTGIVNSTFEIIKVSLIEGVSAQGYSGEYDGKSHGIKVNLSGASVGATVKYGTTEGSYTYSESLTYKDVGTYTVYYQVTKQNYDSVSGYATIKITPKEIAVEWPNTMLKYDGSLNAPEVKWGNRIDGVNGEIIKVNVEGGQIESGIDYEAIAKVGSVINSDGSNGNINNYKLTNETTEFMIIYDIDFEANGGYFETDEGSFGNQNTLNNVKYVDVYGEITRISKTDNISMTGIDNGKGYGNNISKVDVITIPRASELRITITYETEDKNYDWLCLFDGTVENPTKASIDKAVEKEQIGGVGKTTKTYTVSGDTVQIYFKSDNSVCNYYGYYAVIKASGIGPERLDGFISEYKEPTRNDGYALAGWSPNPNGDTVIYELGEVNIPVTEERLYAVWTKVMDLIPSKANAPVLGKDADGNLLMEAIYWEDENGSNEIATTEYTSEMYNYSLGNGRTDSKESKWANAKTKEDGSYWVWIPRYAYKITYTNVNKNQVITDSRAHGNIDILFMYGTSNTHYRDINGNPQPLPEGYIVHPAFQAITQEEKDANVNQLGKWDSELEGIWIAKYEASEEILEDGNTRIVSKPSVRSLGDMSQSMVYSNSKEMHKELGSHEMKNSEWGAVAYLTYSAYGRNGNDVAVNECADYYTGAGPNKGTRELSNGIYWYDESTFASEYAWNTTQGKLASTTGNIYGIYDMSGGCWESVSSYIKDYTTISSTTENNDNLKYEQIYNTGTIDSWNSPDNYDANRMIYGDAVHETSTSYTDAMSWCYNSSIFPDSNFKYFIRGGFARNGALAGMFFFDSGEGAYYYAVGFHPVLCFN